jgi:mitogen-activated protein kinase kinase kinase
MLVCTGVHTPAYVLLQPTAADHIVPWLWMMVLFICQAAGCSTLLLFLLVQQWCAPLRVSQVCPCDATSVPRPAQVTSDKRQPARMRGVSVSWSAFSQNLGNMAAMETIEKIKTWRLFILLATFGMMGADILWAFTGVSSMWFLVVMVPSPKIMRCCTIVGAMGTAAFCSVMQLHNANRLQVLPGVPSPSWQPLVLHAITVLAPSFLMLAQLACVLPMDEAAGRRRRYVRRSWEQETDNVSMGSQHSLCTVESPPHTPSNLPATKRNFQKLRQHLFTKGESQYTMSSMTACGGFCDVYLGLCHNTGMLVCIKQARSWHSDKDVNAMEMEVDMLRSLDHPNIVKYLGTDRAEKLRIILEYVPGGSIALILSTFGPMAESIIRFFSHQALLGLRYLHEKGIIHGDIKGANLLLSDTGMVKLADFGSSIRNMGDGIPPFGTVLWMAPEVCREEPLRPSSDIWSFGCTVLQMATALFPWNERQFEDTIPAFYHIATCTAPPVVPSKVPYAVKRVVHQCLKLDPALRPTCDEVFQHDFFTADEAVWQSGVWQDATMESPRWFCQRQMS